MSTYADETLNRRAYLCVPEPSTGGASRSGWSCSECVGVAGPNWSLNHAGRAAGPRAVRNVSRSDVTTELTRPPTASHARATAMQTPTSCVVLPAAIRGTGRGECLVGCWSRRSA